MNRIKKVFTKFLSIVATVFIETSMLTSPVLAAQAPAPAAPSTTNQFSNLFNNGSDDIPDIPQNDPDLAPEGGDTIAGSPSTVQNSGLYGGTVGVINQITIIVIAVTLIWLVVSFIFCAINLSQHGDNPMMRHQVIHDFYRNIIAIGIIGGLAFFTKIAVDLGKFG